MVPKVHLCQSERMETEAAFESRQLVGAQLRQVASRVETFKKVSKKGG